MMRRTRGRRGGSGCKTRCVMLIVARIPSEGDSPDARFRACARDPVGVLRLAVRLAAVASLAAWHVGNGRSWRSAQTTHSPAFAVSDGISPYVLPVRTLTFAPQVRHLAAQ